MSSIRYRSSVYNNSQDLSDNALVSKLSPSRTFSKYKKIASPNRKSSSRSSPLRKSPLRKSSSRSSPNRLSLINQNIKCKPGQVARKGSFRRGYERQVGDSIQVVRAAIVKPSCAKNTSQNLGIIPKAGTLTRFVYHSYESDDVRLSALDQAVKAYGADEVALKLEGSIRMQSKNRPEYANTMSRDLYYINKTY